MSASMGKETEIDSILSPLLRENVCGEDLTEAEKSLQSLLDALKGREQQQLNTSVVESTCRSLLHAYVCIIRTTAGKCLAGEKCNDSTCKWLLKLTICISHSITELCSLPVSAVYSNNQNSDNPAIAVFLQVLSDLLRPPSLLLSSSSSFSSQYVIMRDKMDREVISLFWQCYPWWCSLLHHCLFVIPTRGERLAATTTNMVARAASWVSRYYTSEKTVGNIDPVVFLSLLHRNKQNNTHITPPVTTRRNSSDLHSNTGCNVFGGESVYAMSLGQSIDVDGTNIVHSFFRSEKERQGIGEKKRKNSSNSNSNNNTLHSDILLDTPGTSSLSILNRRRRRRRKKSSPPLVSLQSLPSFESSPSQQVLCVAAKLGTLFAAQDLHTLLPLRMNIRDVVPQDKERNVVSHTIVEKKHHHCEVCDIIMGIMTERFVLSDSKSQRSLVACSLLILQKVLSRSPVCVEMSVKRSLGEKAAAAAITALLRHDAEMTDTLISLVVLSHESSAFHYFITLWRAAFVSHSKSFSETMAWLFAGFAYIIEKHMMEVGEEVIHFLMNIIGETFNAMIQVMMTLVSVSLRNNNTLTVSDANRLKEEDMCIHGFIKVWDSLLRLTCSYTEPILQKSLCMLIVDIESVSHTHTPVMCVQAQLREFLESYYLSVMKRVLNREESSLLEEQQYSSTQQSTWWPQEIINDLQECKNILQHTLLLSTYICRSNIVHYLSNSLVNHYNKHPAAFFLQGNEGLCMQLLSMQPDIPHEVYLMDLQNMAANIITVVARSFSEKPGSFLFQSPFGLLLSGHYAVTYTRLLYLRFLQIVSQPYSSNSHYHYHYYHYMRGLLSAIRSLTIVEKAAHRTAIGLSLPNLLSRMLVITSPNSNITSTTSKGIEQKVIPVETQRMYSTTTSTLVSPSSFLVDELGSSSRSRSISGSRTSSYVPQTVPDESEKNEKEETRNVDREGIVSPVKPVIPTLALSAMAPPQYFTAKREIASVQDNMKSSPVLHKPSIPVVPPLNLTKHHQYHYHNNNNTQQQREEEKKEEEFVKANSTQDVISSEHHPLVSLDESAQLAELLLSLCCLLPGREGGMISQSSLTLTKHKVNGKLKQSHGDSARCTPPLVRILSAMQTFTHNNSNQTALELFDALVSKEIQPNNSLWIGVDVLRAFLIPQRQLLDGLDITERIGAGGYGVVFSATHTCCNPTRCKHGILVNNTSFVVALKLLPVTRSSTDDSSTLVSCHTEATSLKRLQGHARICEILFCGCTDSHYVIGMPLYKGGSLRSWRLTKSGFPVVKSLNDIHFTMEMKEQDGNSTRVTFNASSSSSSSSILSLCGPLFAQVLEAVEFMHSKHIRHNDLKADNILIEHYQIQDFLQTEDSNTGETNNKKQEIMIPTAIRLCDFGVCEVIGEDMGSMYGSDVVWVLTKGTEAVQAPEMLALTNTVNQRVKRSDTENGIHSTVCVSEEEEECDAITIGLAADMWSCGCLLYELLTGEMLFGGASLGRLLSLAANLQTGEYTDREVLQEHQRELLDGMGRGVRDFVLKLLALKPAERPSASAARQAWEDIILQMEK